MTKVTDLLTDEFIAFSKKIEKIFEEKKAKKVELKAFYDKINADLKALDDEAAAAQEEFDTFRRGEAKDAPEESTKEE
jgi:hypothetical protein